MTIWERVVTALTPLNLPLAESVMLLNGSNQLPDVYLVFFVVASPAAQHADNVEKERTQTVQVTYYNRAGLAGMPEISAAMAVDGFLAGPQRELPYNQQTRHFGYALDFVTIKE